MDAVPVDRWEGVAVDVWRERWGVPVLEVYERIGSTNDAARDLATSGAPEGSVVIAREQRAGRGRRGRSWTATPGRSLLLSMVFRPAAAGADSVLSLRLGLAAARAIEAVAPLTVGIKWPNDLVVDGRKLGGILCEGAFEAGRPVHVVAGIGLNLTQHDDDWPPDLRGSATSIAASLPAYGAAYGAASPAADPHGLPARVAERLVREWLAETGGDAQALTLAEVRAFERRDILRGRAVTRDGVPAGVAAGVTPAGALRVRTGEAGERHVVSGTVRATDDTRGTTP